MKNSNFNFGSTRACRVKGKYFDSVAEAARYFNLDYGKLYYQLETNPNSNTTFVASKCMRSEKEAPETITRIGCNDMTDIKPKLKCDIKTYENFYKYDGAKPKKTPINETETKPKKIIVPEPVDYEVWLKTLNDSHFVKEWIKSKLNEK